MKGHNWVVWYNAGYGLNDGY